MKSRLSKVVAPMTALLLVGGLAVNVDASAQSSRSKSSSSQKRSSSKSSKSSSKSRSSSSKSKSSASKSKSSAGHRLPAYYGQIGLKDAQRDEIYKIQDSYKSEIESLEKKLAALKEKMGDDIEDVLTRTQKTKLNSLKRAAAGGSKSTSSKSSSSKKSSSRSSSKKK